MKKLLSTLTILSLAVSSGTALGQVLNLENNFNQTKANDKGVDALSTDVTFDLKQTQGGNNPLTEQEQEELHQLIIQELVKVNQSQAANVNEDTFIFDLTHATTKTTSVFVKVKSTFSTADLPGLNSGQVIVNLTLKPLVQNKVDPVGTEIKLNLKETPPGQQLSENDKTDLHGTIIEALIKANRNAVVTKETFDFTINELTPESTLINVKVHSTVSTPDKPGVNDKDVEVKLELTAATRQAVDAVGGDIEVQLTQTHNGENLTPKDREELTNDIKKELIKNNEKAAIEDDTFILGDLSELKPGKTTITINVNPTLSTPDKPGLNLGSVDVNLNLIPINLEQRKALAAEKIVLDLEETSEGETLKGQDIAKVRTAIIDGMKKANEGAIFNEDTFSVVAEKIKQGDSTVTVTVNSTESTPDKWGLLNEPVNVQLELAPAGYAILARLENEDPILIDGTKTLIIDNYNDLENIQLDYPRDLLEIGDFNNDGKALITGKWEGTATITISAKNGKNKPSFTLTINKIPLEKAITVREVDGFKYNTVEGVKVGVVEANPNFGLKKEDIEVKNLKPADFLKPGSATIVANGDSKFEGEIDITITVNYKDEWDLDKYMNSNPTIWIHDYDIQRWINAGKISDSESEILILAIWTGILDIGSSEGSGSYNDSIERFKNQNLKDILISKKIADILYKFLESHRNGGHLTPNEAKQIDLTLTEAVMARNKDNTGELVNYKLKEGKTYFKTLRIDVT